MRKPMKFHGKDLRDADRPMVIPLLDVDIEQAEAARTDGSNDPLRFTTCVIARACKRVFGDRAHVRINRTTAYVARPRAKYAARYELSDESREMVERFDRGEPVEPESTIILNPPSQQRRLEVMRTYWQNTEKHRRQGTTKRTQRKQRKSDPITVDVRNGAFARYPEPSKSKEMQ